MALVSTSCLVKISAIRVVLWSEPLGTSLEPPFPLSALSSCSNPEVSGPEQQGWQLQSGLRGREWFLWKLLPNTIEDRG